MPLPATFASSAIGRQSSRLPVTPQEEESVLRTLARGTLSGLGRLGNVLDLPGSSIRDILAGENPFDQWLRPTRPENRTTGRELLTQWGVTRANDPDKWELADFGSFAFELGLDPLTWFTLPIGALSKAGRVAKKAGVIDGLLPRKTDIKGLFSAEGKRVHRAKTTINDLIGKPGQEDILRMAKLEDAGRSLGYENIGKLQESLGDMPLGGLIGTPWGGVVGGADGVSGAVMRLMDRAGHNLRWSPPGRAAYQMFGGKRVGTGTRQGQTTAEAAYRGVDEVKRDSRLLVGRLATDLVEDGILPADDFEAIKWMDRLFEGTDEVAENMLTGASKQSKESYRQVRMELDRMVPEMREWGVDISSLLREPVHGDVYFPRELLDPPRGRGRKGPLSSHDPHSAMRKGYLRGAMGEGFTDVKLIGGTATIRSMGEAAAPMVASDKSVKEIAKNLQEQFGNLVSDLYNDIPASGQHKGDIVAKEGRFKELAKFFKSLDPEVLEAGVYADPLTALYNRLGSSADALESTKAIFRTLVDKDAMAEAFEADRSGKRVLIQDLLRKMGVVVGEVAEDGTATGAVGKFSELLGVSADEALEWVADGVVPKDLADDLTKIYQGFTSPDPIGPIMKAFDSVTNYYKAAYTAPFPAFHSRNLVSGQFRNWTNGTFSFGSYDMARRLARGQSIDVTDIPAIRKMARARGYLVDEDWAKAKSFQKVSALLDEAYDDIPKREALKEVLKQRARTWAAENNIEADRYFDRIRFSREALDNPDVVLRQDVSPVWHSKLKRTLDKVPERVGKEQLLKTLKKSGVKDEEIEWADLDGLFPEGTERVTKEEAQKWVDAHSVEPKETWYGGEPKLAPLTEEDLTSSAHLEGLEVVHTESGEVFRVHDWDTTPPVTRGGSVYASRAGGEEQAFDIGELSIVSNYHERPVTAEELLELVDGEFLQAIHAPTGRKVTIAAEDLIGSRSDDPVPVRTEQYREGPVAEVPMEELSIREPVNPPRFQEYSSLENNYRFDDYRSSLGSNYRELVLSSPIKHGNTDSQHWPGIDDPIVHIRMSDGLDNLTSETLHVDEIQSTLHQKGLLLRQLDDIEKKISKRESEIGADRTLHDPVHRSLSDRRDEIAGRLSRSQHQGPVNPMPFRKNWHELALKRVLREAAETGKTRVTINTGDAVLALNMGGKKRGIYKFYDEILPQSLNKIAKKWGVKARMRAAPETEQITEARAVLQSWLDTVQRFPEGEVPLGISRGLGDAYDHLDELMKQQPPPVWEIPITPEMRTSLLTESQPLFQKGKGQFAIQDSQKIVSLFEGAADASTLIHETGHLFRRDLPKKLQAQAEEAVGQIVGGPVRKSDGSWTVEAEEAFATHFEEYFRTGKSPVPELASVFQKFKEWLTQIYAAIKGTAKVNPGLKDVFDEALGKGRRTLNTESSTDLLRQMVLADFPDLMERAVGEGMEKVGRSDSSVATVMSRLPGATPFSWRNVGKMWAGRTPDTNWDITGVRGVGGRSKTTLGPVRAGEEVAYYVEFLNRVAPYIKQLKEGVDPAQAAEVVKRAQVDYSPAAFSPIESKVFKRMFPFWSFTSRQIPYVLEELVTNPGGRMGTTIKGLNRAHEEDPRVPPHVTSSASIPWGVSEDGTRDYVTSLGLMLEDPASYVGTPSEAILEVLSRLHPIPKAIGEIGTQESFFQKSPTGGGRSLRDLDPTIGRMLSELTGQDRPVDWLGDATRPAEFAIANSPASVVVTKMRQLADSRKSFAERGVNFLTGARISSVSPLQQQRELQNMLSKLMVEDDAKLFQRAYFPDGPQTPTQEKLDSVLRIMRRQRAERERSEAAASQ